MKRFIYILILLGVCFFSLPRQEGYAQNIIWEKQWGFAPGSEQIHKICPTQDGSFFAVGYSTKFRKDTLATTYFYTLLLKIDQNGDTLFMKRLSLLYGYTSFIGHKYNDVYQMVLLTPTSFSSYCPAIIEFSESGIILVTKVFTQLNNYLVGDGVRTPDGGLLFPGVGIGPGTNQCAFKFNFLNELEWANAYFPPVTINGNGNRIEPRANGNYLLSGVVGKRIYGFEIDSAGNEVSQKEFYQTPSNFVLQLGYTSQVWRKGYFSVGVYMPTTSTYKMILAASDSLNQRIWGGEQTGIIDKAIFVNREFSVIYSALEGNNIYLNRLNADSSVLWKVLIGTPATPKKSIQDIYFFQNDTGLVAGFYVAPTGNAGNQFWLAKIAGVGTAYDPTHPEDTITLSAQERVFRPKDSPILFPNPAGQHVQFQKLTAETVVAIYSIKGEKLLEKSIRPNESLDVWQLPKGVYLYHLKMGDRVFTGRFLKE